MSSRVWALTVQTQRWVCPSMLWVQRPHAYKEGQPSITLFWDSQETSSSSNRGKNSIISGANEPGSSMSWCRSLTDSTFPNHPLLFGFFFFFTLLLTASKKNNYHPSSTKRKERNLPTL